ncbi:hypothetical protein [Actinomadura gamaensis]|uniref:Uncharacterized protein n=1 Tax=Actinomadura gamaensis TaxID=1763541 RepID=A0ABV9U3D4_9ACTN
MVEGGDAGVIACFAGHLNVLVLDRCRRAVMVWGNLLSVRLTRPYARDISEI